MNTIMLMIMTITSLINTGIAVYGLIKQRTLKIKPPQILKNNNIENSVIIQRKEQ
jgi:hypothetical protein